MKIKSNRLSIYLIKPEYQRPEDIVSSTRAPIVIGDGQFFSEPSHPHPPDWVTSFFGTALGDDSHLLTSSTRGVFVVPVKHNDIRHFALSFGVGRHLLKDGVIEERFGLKVVLNSLDEGSFRSIDKTTLGSIAKHSREQMGRSVAPSEFGIDIEQDLLNSVTGISRDPRLGKTITGKDALTISIPADATNIKEVLSHCLVRYESTDYRVNFDWIDQIADIRDKKLEETLSNELVERLKARSLDRIWMAVPEVIDWADLRGFRYIRRHRASLHDDLNMVEFLAELRDEVVTTEVLRKSQVFMVSASQGDVYEHWTALRCAYAEISYDDKLYILNNGKWYEVSRRFTEQVQHDFTATPMCAIPLPDCSENDEGAYNAAAAGVLPGACLMDRKMVSYAGGHSKIEFCDLYTNDKKLVHVKRYGGSSVLSHLFSQGVVSGELFVAEAGFRERLNDELPATHKLPDPRARPNPQEFEIVYAIISESQEALDIPFFSKVNLRNARRRLGSYGYRVSLKKIQKL